MTRLYNHLLSPSTECLRRMLFISSMGIGIYYGFYGILALDPTRIIIGASLVAYSLMLLGRSSDDGKAYFDGGLGAILWLIISINTYGIMGAVSAIMMFVGILLLVKTFKNGNPS